MTMTKEFTAKQLGVAIESIASWGAYVAWAQAMSYEAKKIAEGDGEGMMAVDATSMIKRAMKFGDKVDPRELIALLSDLQTARDGIVTDDFLKFDIESPLGDEGDNGNQDTE